MAAKNLLIRSLDLSQLLLSSKLFQNLRLSCYNKLVDQEELELEQDTATLSHARFWALVVLVLAALGLYLVSLLS